MPPFIPFCGTAPVPGTETWTLDPRLLAVLLALLAIYLSVAGHRQVGAKSVSLFVAGWAVLTLSLVSPLCNLSVALFSARVTQHMVLAFLAAPLMSAGLASLFPAASLRALIAASVAFFVVLWIWHSPAPYDLTLHDNRAYWLMQTTIVGASVLLWLALLTGDGFATFLAAGVTGLHMSLLGAILTFAGAPLFSVYARTTEAWGLTQIQDQQLGGLVMWIPAGLALTGYSIAALGFALRRMSLASASSRFAA